jgi:hypothetical protein
MKKIIAKLKSGQNVIVFDDAEGEGFKDMYKAPDVKTAVAFDPNSKNWVEGQWHFVVLTEEQKEEMLGGYVSEAGSMGLDTMTADQYAEVKALYLVSAEEMLFTKVSSRHVLGSKKYVAFGDTPALAEQGNSILLTGEVDAYYNGRLLYFKKFAAVRSLFPGLYKVYKEATEDVTNEFLSSELFELKEEMSSDFISLRNRKKISDIVAEKGEELKDPEAFGKYLSYAQSYDLDLEIDQGKIALIDNGDVNKVIGLFGEQFYTAEISREKREMRTSKKLVKTPRKRAK